MNHFTLPDLGEGLPEATIREWHIESKQWVDEDQTIATIETAKSLVDLPMPTHGYVIETYGQVGDTIKTGTPLIRYEPSKQTTKEVGTLAKPTPVIESISISNPTPPPTSNLNLHRESIQPIQAMPAARALARKMGINLQSVLTHNSHDIITVDDVKRAVSTTQAHHSLTSNQQAMATSISRAYRDVVPAMLTEDADIHTWHAQQHTTYRIISALTSACLAYPLLHAHYHPKTQSFVIHDTVSIGLAVHSKHGLFMPVLRDLTNLTQPQCIHMIDQFKTHAENNSFHREQLTGASIILSNVGSIAGQYATPLVVPPCVATLAVGRIRKQVVAYNDAIAIHPIMPLSLSFDHRVITGGQAALFLREFIKNITLPHPSSEQNVNITNTTEVQ